MNKLIIVILGIIPLSCQPKVDGQFFISNGSKDKPEILLTVLIDNDTIFNQITKYTDIRPDLKYIENRRIEKGKHTIKVTAGKTLSKTDTINFSGDRWIFISYQYEAPFDSVETENFKKNNAEILKLDSTFMQDMRKGREPELIIYMMDKQPIHM